MNILLTIIINLIIVIVLFEIIIRYLIGESLIGIFLAVLHDMKEVKKPGDFGERENEGGINDGGIKMANGIKNEIKRIQKEESSKERIQYRKDCEDEANSILTKNLGRLTKEQVWKIIELLDADYKDGKPMKKRFGPLFWARNRSYLEDTIENKIDEINHLFVEIYAKENLDDFKSIIKSLDGINKGFVTCILYLKDRDMFNVSVDATIDGIKKVFPEDADFHGSFKERYTQFNNLANKLKEECDLEPQEVDLVLWKLKK